MIFTQLHIRMPPLQGHTDIWGGHVPARRASSPWLPLYTRAGTGALLAKADIKSAYRLVPVHPDDRMPQRELSVRNKTRPDYERLSGASSCRFTSSPETGAGGNDPITSDERAPGDLAMGPPPNFHGHIKGVPTFCVVGPFWGRTGACVCHAPGSSD